ncbi:RagB/SusD family nutrient uptake outer membrane protein [Marinilabiliaceae bacterium JC017]|nr:RagB/SusD family nutrient uptake outer membrane protein [Marinilabiliaceae bacterium JC017]
MKNIFIWMVAIILIAPGCNDDYLEKFPIDEATDDTYWTNEENVRLYSWGFYEKFFDGYGSFWTWGKYFTGQSLNDDFGPSQPTQFLKNVTVSASKTNWDYLLGYVRRANLMIDRVKDVPMEEDAVAHWTGVARFFRGMAYYRLVQQYGDVPWMDQVPVVEDPAYLYKPRDPRTVVMDNVLKDFQYAAEHVRASDGEAGLTVNKDVVLAFMSQAFLFEGTWLKYHDVDQGRAKTYLEAAKWSANEIITAGKYSMGESYRGLFSSMSLKGNPEMILYRGYEEGMVTHCLSTYNNIESQTGGSKNLIDSYLCKDGLPIKLSPFYAGDDGIENVMKDRDPRMHETYVQELRLSGEITYSSSTGYSCHKFLSDEIKDLPIGKSNGNPTDAPVIRYGEVLLNYAEACAELGEITQADLNQSINVLRQRKGINLPNLEVVGGQPAVNGVVYDDPNRDPSVSSLIWEIRRERRNELVFEGFRLNDLKRWKKLEYTDTKKNSTINRGAYIRKADHPEIKDIVLEGDAEEGYIVPAWTDESQRLFNNERVYLYPIALDQLKLYKDNGYSLEQNPGWEGLE